MGRRLAQAGLLIVVVLVVAQFVHPENSSPPIDPGRTIAAHLGAGSGVVAVLDRSCAECHSNVTTAWPWYLRMAPVSWVVTRGVEEGRHAVNFSEWGGYSTERQRALLIASCDDVRSGKMPGRPWTLLHPEARLSSTDIDTICAAGGSR